MPPEIPSVFDEKGSLVSSNAFRVVERAEDGAVTIASDVDQPINISRIRYAGFDHPGIPIPVQRGHKIVIPAKPSARLVALGDVIRNGEVVKG